MAPFGYRAGGADNFGVGSSKTDGINRRERAQHLRTLVLGIDRTIGRLPQRLHRSIAVDADDQIIAERPGIAEISDVAWVEDVEDAIGKHDRLALAARLLHERDHLAGVHLAENLMFPPNDQL